MDCISVTQDVSQLEASREVRLEQPESILDISVTREVSQPETSREASEEQP